MPSTPSWTAVGYLRFSSEMQRDSWTIDAQRHEYEEFIAARGWSNGGEYVDEARRASSDDVSKRPAFGCLLEDIERRRFDVVVVHEQSRLARNQLVFQLFLKSCREHGVRLVSIAEGIDTTTPDGEMLMGLLMQFSQHQSRVLAKHVAKAKKERVRRGLANGSVPFGYRRCPCGQGPDGECRGHPPVPVPEEFAAVQMAFERYATGAYTATKIAQLLNEQGFRTRNTRKDPEVGVTGPRPFGKESVVDMLRNPFHAGKVRYRDGELVPGAHEAAVSWDLFERVQQQLDRHARHGRGERTKHTYLLNGLLRCYHCGERVWATTKTVRRNRHGVPIAEPRVTALYRTMCYDRGNHTCPSGDRTIVAWTIDEQVERLVKSLTLPEDWQATVKSLLAADAERQDKERRRTTVQERLRRAARAYADGYLEEAEYEQRKREAEAELASLAIPAERELIDAGRYLADIGRVWDHIAPETRRGIVVALFDAVYIDIVAGRVAEYRPKAAFRPLLLRVGEVAFGDPDGERSRMTQQWDFPVDEPVSLLDYRRDLFVEQLPAIAARIAAGETLRALAAECSTSHETLRRALVQAGFTTVKASPSSAEQRRIRRRSWPGRRRPTLIAQTEAIEFLERHRGGESIRALARRAGVSHETMRRMLAEAAERGKYSVIA